MAKALARAKSAAGVEVATSGYSSYQVTDKNQPTRWRMAQTLSLESADFATMAALVSKLQADDLLLLSGMNFAVSPDARRKAEDALTQQAIKAWQARAQNAARGVRQRRMAHREGDDPDRRLHAAAADDAQPAAMAAGAPPVSVEGGQHRRDRQRRRRGGARSAANALTDVRKCGSLRPHLPRRKSARS